MKAEWKEWIRKYQTGLITAAVASIAVLAVVVGSSLQKTEASCTFSPLPEEAALKEGYLGQGQASLLKISGPEKAKIEAEARKQTAYVTTFGSLNVRSEASLDSEIVGHFLYKQEITLTDEAENSFYPVIGTDSETGEEIVGYCYADYISTEAPPASHVYLTVPSFKQFDPSWKDIRIGGYETLHTAGCTTTCLSMVESYLYGYITPAQKAAETWYNYDGCLSFSSAYTPYQGDDALAVVYQKLHEGIPVLYSRINTQGTAHWVVVVG